MEKSRKKFIIIDGNALVHRAFHALPPLSTKQGQMVNAVYGFTSILLKVMKDLRPDYMAMTYDLPGPTFRDDLYKEYKATRTKQPDELYAQIPLTEEIVKAFQIPIFTKKGFEADDVIGTLVRHKDLRTKNIETIIVTGDMDTLQLVDDHTKVYTTKRGVNDTILYDEEKTAERYGGLRPDQLIDYKALRGDPSDNIPGVKGIGEKGAIELIHSFGTIENLYQALQDKKPAIREKLQELLRTHEKEAFLSKKLSTIVTDIPLKFRLEECERKPYDQEALYQLFSRFEFKSLLSRLPTEAGSSQAQKNLFSSSVEKNTEAIIAAPEGASYHLVQSEKDIRSLFKNLAQAPAFVLDTETDSLDPITGGLLGISFCWKEKEAYYLDYPALKNFPALKKDLHAILKNPKIKKYGHNIKYDLNILTHAGFELENIFFDSMIASYILNPGSRTHGLDQLAFTELGHRMIPIEDLIGKGKKQISMRDVDKQKVAIYSSEDADFTWRLSQKLEKDLIEKNLDHLFRTIEMPLVPVLARMERKGISLDGKKLERIKKDLHSKIKKLEEKIYSAAGTRFNINSPLQLKEILFEKLKIRFDDLKKGKTGISTAASELEKLRGRHRIIDFISEYREYTKLVSTYVEALPALINKETGRIHTSFNQTIAATGRLSSSDPNLQNIPIRTEEGQKIRSCFVAGKGNTLLSLDYSQFELRIVAAMAKDDNMKKIFEQGKDIHATTASEIYGVPQDKVTKSMRNAAKAVNFGVLYGMGVYGLSQGAALSREEAQDFIDRYFALFHRVHDYLELTKALARKQGYVETIFGRRRYLPEMNSNMMQVRRAAERMAINMPVQGTEADLIKMAMIEIDKHMLTTKADSEVKMLLQVHDELVFEVQEGIEKKWAKKFQSIMENIYDLGVPVVVEAKVGKNWEEMEKIM